MINNDLKRIINEETPKQKINKKILLISIILISIIGISFAWFNYIRKGSNQVAISSELYVVLEDETDTINLVNVYPLSKEEAREREDNTLTFSVSGKNTSNMNILYEILLLQGEEEENKLRIKPNHLKFDLIEINENNEEIQILDAVSFPEIEKTVMHREYVNSETLREITRTYTLRVWLSNEILVSDTDPNADYKATGENAFSKHYASVKIAVNSLSDTLLGGYTVEFYPNRNNLPNAYTELDYIEGTGTQYIQTNIIPTDNTGIYIKMVNKDSSSNLVYFGSGESSNDNGYWIGNSGNKFYFRWDALYSSNLSLSRDITNDVMYTFKMNYLNDRKFLFNDTVYYSSLSTINQKANPMTIFGYYRDSTNNVSIIAKMRLYEFKVSKGSNIIANFVPCFRNSDDKTGLYDVINNVFYPNADENEFIKGYKTQTFTYDESQNLLANTYTLDENNIFDKWNTNPNGSGTSYEDRELVNNLSSKNNSVIKLYAQWESTNTRYNFYPNYNVLPLGYNELEYIEGTGTQYVLTSVIPTSNTGVYIKMLNKDVKGNLVYFGSGNASNHDGYWIGNSSNSFYMRWDILYSRKQGNIALPTDISNNRLYTFELNYLNSKNFTFNNDIYVNGLGTLKSKTLPISIFGYNNSSSNTVTNIAKMRLYEFKISNGDHLVANYIPCYRISDNVGGLYDIINNNFNPSEGANAFVNGKENKLSQKIFFGTSENLIDNPYERTGYNFISWNTSPDGSGTTYQDKELVSNNNANNAVVHLYAQWEKIT